MFKIVILYKFFVCMNLLGVFWENIFSFVRNDGGWVGLILIGLDMYGIVWDLGYIVCFGVLFLFLFLIVNEFMVLKEWFFVLYVI